ncbi:MAG: AAA family ATPase [Thermoplasmata archaeon]|nr:AAA family ATPase [Thermoplasmata archaeon]
MPVEKVKTYIEGFDELLDGGIPKGSLVLICGTPGTMKTTLAYSILHGNASNGSRGLFITLEETQEGIASAMEELGMNSLKESELYILDVGAIRREHRQEEASKDWFDILSRYIEQRVKEDKFDIVAIDSLDALYSLFSMENPRADLYHFFGSLKELGSTTLLVSEIPYGKDRLVSFDEDFLADGILLLKQYEVGETDVQLRIRCVKMRRSNHFQGYLTLLRGNDRFMVTRVISE